MKILCENTKRGLVPKYDSDLDEKKKLTEGWTYWCEIKKARNYQFHKKFFALCKIGCENSQNVDMPLDAYRKYATIKAGYFKTYVTPKGNFIEADSIAFENMSQEDFEQVYSAVLGFIINDTGATKEVIEHELISFL